MTHRGVLLRSTSGSATARQRAMSVPVVRRGDAIEERRPEDARERPLIDPHRDAATDPWRAHKPRPDRSRPSCRLRRVCAIAFAGKESCDATTPNDHSVAEAIADWGRVETKAIMRCDDLLSLNAAALRCPGAWLQHA